MVIGYQLMAISLLLAARGSLLKERLIVYGSTRIGE